MVDRQGLVSRRSAHDAEETARRLRLALAGAGLTVFCEIDHGRNAVEIGMALRPTLLVVFGNPRGGTPLMQIDQRAGIDLPFKALIWTDVDGVTWMSWNDPRWLAERHDLGAEAEGPVGAILTGMDKLAAAATA